MRRYRFRLETVLRVRSLEEEGARVRLLEANGAVTRARSGRDEAAGRYSGLPVFSGPCSVQDFRGSRRREEMAAATLAARQFALEQAGEMAEEARLGWMAARGRVRVLERLDERRRAEHGLEVGRDEGRFLDDIGTTRHGMNDAD